jgi:integrase
MVSELVTGQRAGAPFGGIPGALRLGRVEDARSTAPAICQEDEAIIRLYHNTGARLSEVDNLSVEDVDLTTESVHFRGKGSRDRRVRFGPKTARALSRYLRARAKHKGAELPELWLADRGGRPLAPNGIKIRLKRLGAAAGLSGVHAHRWRHNSRTNGNRPVETWSGLMPAAGVAGRGGSAVGATVSTPRLEQRPHPVSFGCADVGEHG